MPTASPRPCAEPGCPNLVTGRNVYRCPEHQREYLRRWEKPRDVAYDRNWKLKSRIFLANHPVCARCGEPSQLTHHITRKREGGADDWDNLEALCRRCHEIEHEKSGERWKRHERA